ncbi:MAG: roadblock/LC7 domain-containing protein [Promethearchaeota archaeon]|nr:MAG: roadblock/LC7 domain-containing protein [Candidatus Lokiarchaeota archaeon]
MDYMNHSNLQKFNALYQILDDIKNQGNLEGIIFAYRDGKLIIENLGDKFDSKKFISMCASVLESALGIGEALGNREINKIVAEVEEKAIIIFECDDKTFLTILIKKESNVNLILSKLKEIIQKIVKMY